MKHLLIRLALLVAVAAVAAWLATGAHVGWTKTSIQKMTVDEITGIESPSYEKGFVPGVDFLAAALLGASLLAGASLLFRKQPQPHSNL